MNADTLRLLAVTAKYYDEDADCWNPDAQWKFKDADAITKGVLKSLNHHNLIEADDTWGTRRWSFTEEGQRMIRLVQASDVLDLDDEQRHILRIKADRLLDLPVGEFRASEEDLIGQELQSLSSAGYIVKVEDELGEPAVWSTSELLDSLLFSVEPRVA